MVIFNCINLTYVSTDGFIFQYLFRKKCTFSEYAVNIAWLYACELAVHVSARHRSANSC